MSAGLSPALVYRIEVRGRPYLLRINISPISDPRRWFACMGAAAAAGLGPAVRYTSVEDKISITDFVHRQPLPPQQALRLLPPLLRALHALPAAVAAEILPHYARLRGAFIREPGDLVASHNDLNPGNILYDGTRLWLVDWEAAFLNHRYVDLAVVANFVAGDAMSEEALLSAYFGQSPTAYQRARFYLMQQLAHLFYAALLAPKPQAGATPALDWDATLPSFRDLHDQLWRGEASLVTAEARIEYGRVHLNQLRLNLQSPRLEAALGVAATAHA